MEATPKLSFGVPVYNGEQTIGRLLASLRAQTFDDFEVVVLDNASTDTTVEVVRSHVAHDPRIRLVQNPSNIGVDPNFNRVRELGRGEYFRWVSVDDWVDAAYAERCTEVLDEHPEAIGVTTGITFHQENGQTDRLDFTGERVDQAQPHLRFARTLELLRSDFRIFDPVYAVYRRGILAQARFRNQYRSDHLFATEIALLGPLVHVPEFLAHRTFKPRTIQEDLDLLQDQNDKELTASLFVLHKVNADLIKRAPLTRSQRLHCYRALALHASAELYDRYHYHVRGNLGHWARQLGLPVDSLREFVRRW